MGFPRPVFNRALAIAVTTVIAAGTLLALESAPASADGVQPLDLSTGALPTVQVDGVVWSQVVVGSTVYVGGSFTTARPLSGGTVSRANVLAYNLVTGELVSSFVANTNGAVQSIAAAPDGSRIYIAGTFTTVNGVGHNRVAALDPTSGTAIGSFTGSLNSTATGVVASRSAVYVIGNFTQSNGVTVSKAAALDPSTGSTLSWKPAFDSGTMRAITISPDGSVVLIGGGFTSVGGVHAGGLAAIDASTGQLRSWGASSVIDLGGAHTGIYGLSTDGTYAYATGWSYDDSWGENSLEGVASMKWDSGDISWIEDCHGDSYSASSMNGIVYVASHAHFCGNVPNGFGELASNTGHRATAFSVKASGVLAHNTEQGPAYYQDFGGQPAPEMMNFFPDLTIGTFTGQSQAAWSVAASGNYVTYGGEFPKVNGVAQAGLVRFYEPQSSPVDPVAPAPAPTDTATPTPTPSPTVGPIAAPNRVSKPDAVALGPSAVAIKWSAVKAASKDKVSGYVVKVYRGSKIVKSLTEPATKRSVTVTGLARSTTYRIAVAAKNAAGTGKLSTTDSARTKAKGKNVSASKRPSKVKTLKSGAGKTRLRIHWTSASVKGALPVLQYQVRLTLHGKTVKVVSVGARDRSKLISNLKRHSGYRISVRAGSWAGWGAWSAARATRTK